MVGGWPSLVSTCCLDSSDVVETTAYSSDPDLRPIFYFGGKMIGSRGLTVQKDKDGRWVDTCMWLSVVCPACQYPYPLIYKPLLLEDQFECLCQRPNPRVNMKDLEPCNHWWVIGVNEDGKTKIRRLLQLIAETEELRDRIHKIGVEARKLE